MSGRTAAFPRSFWDRYLEVFDGVRVVARVKPVAEARPEWKRADGGAVEFASVKHYIGVQDYLRHAREVKQSVRAAFDRRDAFILRVPSQLAVLLMPVLMRRRHPFAVEVVSDPHDAFSPGAIRHPLRPVFRRLLSRRLARDCRNSFAACYVTAESLQRRYPPGRGTESFYYSDVELNGEFAAHPRPPQPKNTWKLLTVSSLAQLYKAVDVQIDAVAELRRQGLDVQLTVVGEGKHRHELEQRASALRLGDAVSFRGSTPLRRGDSCRVGPGRRLFASVTGRGLAVRDGRGNGPGGPLHRLTRGWNAGASAVRRFWSRLATCTRWSEKSEKS